MYLHDRLVSRSMAQLEAQQEEEHIRRVQRERQREQEEERAHQSQLARERLEAALPLRPRIHGAAFMPSHRRSNRHRRERQTESTSTFGARPVEYPLEWATGDIGTDFEETLGIASPGSTLHIHPDVQAEAEPANSSRATPRGRSSNPQTSRVPLAPLSRVQEDVYRYGEVGPSRRHEPEPFEDDFIGPADAFFAFSSEVTLDEIDFGAGPIEDALGTVPVTTANENTQALVAEEGSTDTVRPIARPSSGAATVERPWLASRLSISPEEYDEALREFAAIGDVQAGPSGTTPIGHVQTGPLGPAYGWNDPTLWTQTIAPATLTIRPRVLFAALRTDTASAPPILLSPPRIELDLPGRMIDDDRIWNDIALNTSGPSSEKMQLLTILAGGHLPSDRPNSPTDTAEGPEAEAHGQVETPPARPESTTLGENLPTPWADHLAGAIDLMPIIPRSHPNTRRRSRLPRHLTPQEMRRYSDPGSRQLRRAFGRRLHESVDLAETSVGRISSIEALDRLYAAQALQNCRA